MLKKENKMDENKGTPSSNTGSANDVLEELRELGENLRDLLQSMWESDERKKLEHELETGLNEAYNNLSTAAKEFAESPTGKNIKTELEDFGQRVRSGEIEEKVRSDILSVLRSANQGLRSAAESSSLESEESSEPSEADSD
jgi:hypothetical protein